MGVLLMPQDLEGPPGNPSERHVPLFVVQPNYHQLRTIYVLEITLKAFKAIFVPKGLAQ